MGEIEELKARIAALEDRVEQLTSYTLAADDFLRSAISVTIQRDQRPRLGMPSPHVPTALSDGPLKQALINLRANLR